MTDTITAPATPSTDRRFPWGPLAFALVLVAIAALVMASTFTIRITKVDDAFGPRLLPQALAVLVGLGGVVTFIQALLRYRAGTRPETRIAVPASVEGDLAEELSQIPDTQPARIGPIPVAGAIVASTLVYVALIPLLGFHISTAVFCVGALLICGVRKWTTLVLFPIGTLLFLYLVFEKLLSVRFP